MGAEIGNVNINLRMSLAKFQEDVGKGKTAAADGAAGIASSFKSGTGEAKASLALLGEEMGVTIPRHIRGLIADLPGVGAALGAAFSGIAVIALIQTIVDVIKKVQEYRNAVDEATPAWTKVSQVGQESLRKLWEEGLELQRQIDSLNGNYLGALQIKLQLIGATSLDHLIDEFKKAGQAADDAFKTLTVSGFASFFGLGNNQAVENAKKDLDDILTKVNQLRLNNNNAGIGALLDSKISQIKSFVNVPFENDEHPEVRQKALQAELDTLTQLRAEYDRVNENASKDTTVAKLTDQKRALQDVNAEAKRLYEQYVQLSRETEQLLAKDLDGYDQEKQKINDLIGKWTDYKTAWEASHKGISAIANEQITKLTQEIGFLNEEAQASIRTALAAASAASKQAADIKSIGSSTNNGSPLYGGTAEAQQLYKLQTDSNASVAEGQKVFTATRTAAENYANTIAQLNVLLAKGDISQDTYNRAQAKASVTGAEFRQLGSDIGHDIEQAAIFGSSWSDTFKAIGIEVAELILKMTLLKTASSAATSGGIGGFFNSLATGLTSGGGHADGGPVTPGHYYTVGERGAETFMPNVPGYIVPNGATAGQKPVYNVTMNISTPDANSFGKSQGQILHEARRHLAGRGGRL